MNPDKEKAIKKAQEYLAQTDECHGYNHAKRVLDYAIEIAKNYPEANLEVLEVAAWWHDVGRKDGDKGHHQRSAEMAREELPDFGYSKEFADKVYKAIVNHSSHAEKLPENIEGKIIKDADKLEFLTLDRWRETVAAGLYHYVEISIKDIPNIRNGLLFSDKAKEMFDQLLIDLKIFAKSEKDPEFQKYRQRILDISVKIGLDGGKLTC